MFEALIASGIVALCSLIGVAVFGGRGQIIGTHRYVLPLAVGVFLGVVFLTLIPETLDLSPLYGAFAILAGFLGFYLLSHILSTLHNHSDDVCSKNGARMLLIGDAIHNFADGVVIVTAFLLNPALGIVTTIGVILHELPQEIAEFGVLVQAGYSKKRAVLLNLLSASTVVVGVVVTLLLTTYISELVWVVTGIAAGNLLYIATSDLIPELRAKHKKHFYQTFLMTVLGVVFIAVMLNVSHAFIENAGVEHKGEYESHNHTH